MLERELFAFLENTADAAFSVSEAGEIRSWNCAAEELFGYAPHEIVGKLCHEVLASNGAKRVWPRAGRCSMNHGAGSRVPNFDLELSTRSGGRIWVNISTLVFEDCRSNSSLLVHLARDVSARKRSEAALARLLETARQAMSVADGGGDRHAPVSPLSEQEARILRLFSKAKNSAEIARELGITLPTLRNHLHAINQKMRTHNRLEAVMQAIQRGLI